MNLEQALAQAIAADDPDAIAVAGAALDAADTATRDRLNQPGALKAAALYYSQVRHWPVFPCKPGEKVPATRHGLKDATTDLGHVYAWWYANPDYNIGLPTGLAFDVIDIDGHQGIESLRKFMRATVPDDPDDLLGHKWTNTDDILPPKLGTVLTPRHPGVHYYIPPTSAGNTVGRHMPGIDFRGLGGYVLAPPSRTEHGVYRWVTPVPEGAA